MGFISFVVWAIGAAIAAGLFYFAYLNAVKTTTVSGNYNQKTISVGLPSVIYVVLALVTFVCGMGVSSSFGEIEAGHLGLQRQYGAFTGKVFQPGLYSTTPFITSVDVVDTRVQQNEVDATPVTKDQQSVPMKISINYALSSNNAQIIDLLNNNQDDYYKNAMEPALAGSIRAVTTNYRLPDLLDNRDQVQNQIVQEFTNRLHQIKGTSAIQIELVTVKDITLDPNYQEAVQKKNVAFQETQTAQQVLQRIKYETQQKVVAAEGQAKAQAAQARTITPDYLRLQTINNDLEVRKLAVSQWNGQIAPFAANPFGPASSPSNGGGATLLDARDLTSVMGLMQPKGGGGGDNSQPQSTDSPQPQTQNTDTPQPQGT